MLETNFFILTRTFRPVCNMCNAPKPKAVLTQEEIRTGAGGGFNERQERAAATSIEVADDGYDDFGRRAKEKKASDKKAKEVPCLQILHLKYALQLYYRWLLLLGCMALLV